MSRLIWNLKYDGKEYLFDPREQLTVGALRQIKQWFGAELGRAITFQGALVQQDPEAALCALWLARKAAGDKNVPEPNHMDDFSVITLFENGADVLEDDEGEAPKAGEEPPTPGSTATRKRSTTSG